jgi:pimeloyl-ACP methyl ester carboxylesterase
MGRLVREESMTLETAGATIDFRQSGEGPDLLWLAAGDQPGDVWRRWQTPFFDRLFRSTTFDARGVGATRSKTEPPWAISEHARDAALLIESACSPPTFLVGLSMGSLIAQELCFTRPELVRAAIVMGTCVKKTGFIREWEQAEIDFRRDGGVLSREFALAHYAFLYYPAEALGDDALWAEIREFLARDFADREGEMLAAQWQACLDYDSSMRLPACDVPIHVIAFAEDVQTPPARAREVAELARSSTFHLLEGLGHGSAFGHRPDVVNGCIAEILSQYEDIAALQLHKAATVRMAR